MHRMNKHARRWVLGCLMLGMAWGVAMAQEAGFVARAFELNNDGIKRLHAGDDAGAVQAFRQARNLAPGNATLAHNLTQALNAWAVKLGAVKDYARSVEMLREAVGLDPNQPTMRSNLAVARLNWATGELEAKRLEAAEELLAKAAETATAAQAVQIDDRRATLHLFKAQDARRAGNARTAQEELRLSLQFNSTYVPSLLETADILYRQGDNEQALEYYVEARDKDPHVEGLAAMIDKIAREQKIEGSFEKRASGDFTVSYEGSVNESAARDVLDILWHASREIGRELDAYPSEKLQVVLYTRDQYNGAVTAPDWSGALFDGKIRVPLPGGALQDAQRARLRQTLYHEYAHALVSVLTPDVKPPTWLNEGIACYFELDRSARRERDDNDRGILAGLASRGELKTVEQLPETFTGIADARQAELAYRVSRNFVSWLAGRQGMSRARAVLVAIRDGKTSAEAIEDAYREDLPSLEKRWADSLAF
jgi:tetratricopeptide (TPR) repeat protein